MFHQKQTSFHNKGTFIILWKNVLFLFLNSLFIVSLTYFTPFQEFCEVDFFILHIGNNDQSCLHFIRLLEQEGYHCGSNVIPHPTESLVDTFCEMIQNSRNYIIWISSENNRDNELSIFLEIQLQWTAIERHEYFLPYIFRLNNCQVPEYFKKYEKYETYELSTDFPCKMAEILEYLKRSPTKGILYLYI